MFAAGQNLPSLLDNAGNLIFVAIWVLLVVGGIVKNLFKKKSENAESDSDDAPAHAGGTALSREQIAHDDPIDIALAMRDAQARAEAARRERHARKTRPPQPSDEEIRERRRALLLEKQRDAEARLARAYAYARNLEAQIAAEFPQTPQAPRSRALGAYAPGNARGAAHGGSHVAASEVFADREALRRAVLAQEILSPPLALRR